jgi:DNA-binding MarR family transcriptional regulator
MQEACGYYAGNLHVVKWGKSLMATADFGGANVIALLRRTTQVMVADLVQRLQRAGYPEVSGAYHPLFENIDPKGTRLTVLAARAGMTHQSMSELVQSLERRGYVERRVDPSDHRARLVRLTPKGRHMVTRAIREIQEIEREWLDHVEASGLHGNLKSALRATLLWNLGSEDSFGRGEPARTEPVVGPKPG